MTDILDQLVQVIDGLPKRGRPPGQPGTSNRHYEYVCSVCKKNVGRDHLFQRQVTFIKLTTRKRRQTRNVDWVCDVCIETHSDYDRLRYSASPGMKDLNAQG